MSGVQDARTLTCTSRWRDRHPSSTEGRSSIRLCFCSRLHLPGCRCSWLSDRPSRSFARPHSSTCSSTGYRRAPSSSPLCCGSTPARRCNTCCSDNASSRWPLHSTGSPTYTMSRRCSPRCRSTASAVRSGLACTGSRWRRCTRRIQVACKPVRYTRSCCRWWRKPMPSRQRSLPQVLR